AVAGIVDDIDRRAGVGARHLDQVVEAVIDVARDQPARIGDGGAVVVRVIAVDRRAGERRGDLDQAVERVEGPAGDVGQRVGKLRDVADIVVGIARRLPRRADALQQAAELVEYARLRLGEGGAARGRDLLQR